MSAAEFIFVDLPRLSRAIDDLLVAHHGLRYSLDAVKRAPVPFTVGEATAMEAFGVGSPLFHLWNECRLVEALRVAWTGEPSPTLDSPANRDE
jgi:hypothetical protein